MLCTRSFIILINPEALQSKIYLLSRYFPISIIGDIGTSGDMGTKMKFILLQ